MSLPAAGQGLGFSSCCSTVLAAVLGGAVGMDRSFQSSSVHRVQGMGLELVPDWEQLRGDPCSPALAVGTRPGWLQQGSVK